jgi:spore maturation protein CgeB
MYSAKFIMQLNMKILYVDLKYDYGVKSRGINHIGQDGFLKSFKKLGYETLEFYYDDYLNNISVLQEKIKSFSDESNPDFIFFSLFTNQFKIKTLDYLRSKYTTINWFGDDQWRFDDFSSMYAKHFTYCITTDKYSIQKYKNIGQKNVIYSQWAATGVHQPLEFSDYKYDVTFVGGFHPYRKWFIDVLIKNDINVQVFGHGWKNGAVSVEEMNKLFCSSKINLNISNSISFDSRYLLSGIKPLINGFRSQKNASQIKARNFEIPFFYGFQLTDYVSSIEDYFNIGKELICYKDVDEATMLIKFYLENKVERELIKDAGCKRAIQEHGYINRLKNIMDTIQ